MSRSRAVFRGVVAAAMTLGVVGLSARSDLGSTASLSGKFTSGAGDAIVLAVDGSSRVSGFFERDGVFGQLDGRAEGDRVEGRWFDHTGEDRCDSELMGSRSWGSFAFRVDDSGRLEGFFTGCGSAAIRTWKARRVRPSP